MFENFGSLEKATINVDYAQFKHFSHFGSVEQRVKNMKTKLVNLEVFQQKRRKPFWPRLLNPQRSDKKLAESNIPYYVFI